VESPIADLHEYIPSPGKGDIQHYLPTEGLLVELYALCQVRRKDVDMMNVIHFESLPRE
jgi:hypothetical protein